MRKFIEDSKGEVKSYCDNYQTLLKKDRQNY